MRQSGHVLKNTEKTIKEVFARVQKKFSKVSLESKKDLSLPSKSPDPITDTQNEDLARNHKRSLTI